MDDKDLQKEEESKQNLTFKPTKKMILYVDKLLDLDERLPKYKIAEEIGITRETIWVWYKNVRFINWLNEQAMALFAESKAERIKTAIRKAKSGDYNFSRIIMELEGLYTPAISHNISIKVTEIVITHVIEVINKFIEDDNLKRKIGEELTRINLN